jgi:hypothetical protein
MTATDKLLGLLLAYIVLTIPFVQWPGSVLWNGIPNFVKGVVFYYFTVATVTNEVRLKAFMATFLGCQVVRVVEPLYLHVTEGYWGSGAYLGEGEFMMRLSGAPSDVINPNGLAFVILTSLPFLYWLLCFWNTFGCVLFLSFMPMMLYSLVLTGSRTGLVVLVAIVMGVVAQSRRKVALTIVMAICGFIAFANLDEGQKERYTSLFSNEGRHVESARGRTDAWATDFEVALETPFVGHGLGTSAEARVHASYSWQPAHNLFFEVWQELGLIGLTIFAMLLLNVWIQLLKNVGGSQSLDYTGRLKKALKLWLFMNAVFSLASYGLSSYEWYLLGGLSVVLQQIAKETAERSPANGEFRG